MFLTRLFATHVSLDEFLGRSFRLIKDGLSSPDFEPASDP